MTVDSKTHSMAPALLQAAQRDVDANEQGLRGAYAAALVGLVEQLEAARQAALELREHMAYDEYGFVHAAVEHILGNSEMWDNYEHSNPAREPS